MAHLHPTLELLRIHRKAIALGWPPEAYKALARWCSIHRPDDPSMAGIWAQLASTREAQR